MTYSELLHSVSFDEIIPFIKKYHGHSECTVLYKTHYDMLRMMTPHRGDDGITTSIVSNAKHDYYGEESRLHASSMEGDFWNKCLAKELIIKPDVEATLAEIAACCLWHTSFYGFTEEQISETAEEFDYYSRNLLDYDIIKDKAIRLIRMIVQEGGKMPGRNEILSIPSVHKKVREEMAMHNNYRAVYGRKHKQKGTKRKVITHNYHQRIVSAGTFVEACLPVRRDGIPIDILCKLFYANHFNVFHYKSYTDDFRKRTPWMMELIGKYDAFSSGILANVMVCVAVAPEHPFLDSEHALLEQIAALCPGNMTCMIKTDGRLGEELLMSVAFYE